MKNQIKSEEEIGNILLAEFMGFDAEYLEARKSFTANGLNYSTDWNLLMGVVEKIESLGYSVSICYTRVVVECFVMSDKTVIYKNDNNSIHKIKNAFLACVEFAKWDKNNSHE
jgi:hypothetical protein